MDHVIQVRQPTLDPGSGSCSQDDAWHDDRQVEKKLLDGIEAQHGIRKLCASLVKLFMLTAI